MPFRWSSFLHRTPMAARRQSSDGMGVQAKQSDAATSPQPTTSHPQSTSGNRPSQQMGLSPNRKEASVATATKRRSLLAEPLTAQWHRHTRPRRTPHISLAIQQATHQVGWRGGEASFMSEMVESSRSPLRRLHALQAVMTFSHEVGPPGGRGVQQEGARNGGYGPWEARWRRGSSI